MKPTLKGEIPVGDEQEAGQGYAEAESILDDWSYRDLPDGEDIIWAIDKAKQAIRDCLEMGLNGEGD